MAILDHLIKKYQQPESNTIHVPSKHIRCKGCGTIHMFPNPAYSPDKRVIHCCGKVYIQDIENMELNEQRRNNNPGAYTDLSKL